MDSIAAACGLDCAACPAFIATSNNDLAALAKLAEDWGRQFGFSATADQVRCHGCHAEDGVQIGHCGECAVRLCAVGKGHVTCAECLDFGCPTMEAFVGQIPEARARLEGRRTGQRRP